MNRFKYAAAVAFAILTIAIAAPTVASAATWYSWDVWVTPTNPVPGQTVTVHIRPFADGMDLSFRPAYVGIDMLTWYNGEKLRVQAGPRHVTSYDAAGALTVRMVVPARATRAANMLIYVTVAPDATPGLSYLDPGGAYVVLGPGVSSSAAPLTITSSAATARLTRTFVLSGRLTGGSIGDIVPVEVKKPGSPRWSYSSARAVYATSGTDGLWWYRYAPKVKGSYLFRAHHTGSVSTAACLSDSVSVLVK